ncbi:MAG TPA: FtsX-like permease family protein, partial [Bryobacteraceae bacterium]|nr:FtsX-like permease family protein [Bryobacteraceae bacterium]
FSANGIPVASGREFSDSDTATSPYVVIINQAMAKTYWPGENPIGQQLGPGSTRYPVGIIVGVVADFKHMSLRQTPGPEMYVPFTQKPWTSMLTFQAAIRTKADPASMAASARTALRSADPDLPAAKVATLTDLVNESMSAPRFTMFVLIGFGVLALLLASIGMYGVVAYSVRQRTREIGIRMALGAGKSNVLAMVFGQAGRLAGLGIAIGVMASLALTRLLSTFLFGVSANDPLTFAAVIALLAAISILAAYVPARRATRVDPMAALHEE